MLGRVPGRKIGGNGGKRKMGEMKEAMFWEKAGKDNVKCVLCPHSCVIPEDKTGFCRVRKNVKGKLYSLVYGRPCSLGVDPIEKKPFFHFAPGTRTYSVATFGCNLRCLHCQNWEISQGFGEVAGLEVPPEKLIENARSHNVQGLSYTYTEPTVFYEYALDAMKLAKKEGLYNTWVTNGYTSPEAIKAMAKYLNAANVDLKGGDEFYRKICSGKGVQPVFDALLAYKKHKIWTEITTLVIEGHNDSGKEIRGLVKWIADNLGPDVPLHFSAFHPDHRLTNVGPTKPETLEKCHAIAKKEGLHWVYIGNVYGHPAQSTVCWKCGQMLVEREGFSITSFRETCQTCGTKLLLKGKKWSSMAVGRGGPKNKYK